MIKIAGVTVLVLVFAVSAQAQPGHIAGGASSSASPTYATGGSGGGSLGPSGFRSLPYIPPTHFAVRTVSGDANDYIPSTFVPYKTALAEGNAALSARPASLGQFARHNEAASPTRAKIELVQDHNGKPVIRRR